MSLASAEGRLDRAELERAIEEGRIETIITAVPDLYGRLIGKRITGHFFLEEVIDHGMHLCDYLFACDMEMDPTPGYAYASWDTGYGDFRALPDLSSLRQAAWLDRTAIVLCDATTEPGDRPVEVSPRRILRRQLARAAEAGFAAHMGSELEFFLFHETYAGAREKGYRDLVTSQGYVEDYHVLSSGFAEPVIGAIRRELDASAIPVEFSKGEWGPGQHEINLRYAPALEMADRHVVYKLAAKEIAARHDCALTFMAKWKSELAGNSLHIHMSFTDSNGRPVFGGGKGATELAGTEVAASDTFRFVLGGLLARSRELSLLLAPTVNSYKRYQEGSFAPTRLAWSYDNRTVGFRVVGSGDSLRVECRIPGGDANPYLAYAALLAAALDGIEHQTQAPPSFQGDAYAAESLPSVPGSLADAIAEFERSDFARQAFGDDVVEHLLHFARTEQRGYDKAVTDFERARYFERI